MVAGTRSACPFTHSYKFAYSKNSHYSPVENLLQDIRVLMDSAVVHYYNGVRVWKRIHVIKQVSDEFSK